MWKQGPGWGCKEQEKHTGHTFLCSRVWQKMISEPTPEFLKWVWIQTPPSKVLENCVFYLVVL